jgi:hypothetical protein
MILSTLMFSVFRAFLSILQLLAYNPWCLFKISFIWFFVALALSYSYFLWTHQSYLENIRKEFVLLLFKSLWMGLVCGIILVSTYEFILQMLCYSTMFMSAKDQICQISLMASSIRLFQVLAFLQICLSSFFASWYLEPFLEQWYEHNIVHGLHWVMIAATAISLSFLLVVFNF